MLRLLQLQYYCASVRCLPLSLRRRRRSPNAFIASQFSIPSLDIHTHSPPRLLILLQLPLPSRRRIMGSATNSIQRIGKMGRVFVYICPGSSLRSGR